MSVVNDRYITEAAMARYPSIKESLRRFIEATYPELRPKDHIGTKAEHRKRLQEVAITALALCEALLQLSARNAVTAMGTDLLAAAALDECDVEKASDEWLSDSRSFAIGYGVAATTLIQKNTASLIVALTKSKDTEEE